MNKMVYHDFKLVRREKKKMNGQKPKGYLQTKFNREHTSPITIRLNNKTDADIIAWLSTLDNKQGTIKALMRSQMLLDGFYYSPPIEAPNNDKPLPND